MNAENLKGCLVKRSLRWFHFRQNNSGGRFHRDDKVDENVIIQAHSPAEANDLAGRIGIYFYGVSDGSDCGCCGDRWIEQWPDEVGDEVPMIYSDVVDINNPPKNTKLYSYGSI